jgi:hypothetical protein
MVHATDAAREALREDEALVYDWHRVAICCAAAGEVSLRRDSGERLAASPSFRRLAGDVPIYAHRMAYPHLAGREVTIDCRRMAGLRRSSQTSRRTSASGLRWGASDRVATNQALLTRRSRSSARRAPSAHPVHRAARCMEAPAT